MNTGSLFLTTASEVIGIARVASLLQPLNAPAPNTVSEPTSRLVRLAQPLKADAPMTEMFCPVKVSVEMYAQPSNADLFTDTTEDGNTTVSIP